MISVIVLAEKTSSTNKELTLKLLEHIIATALSNSLPFGLIYYGEKATPILDPVERLPHDIEYILSEYESTPDLGKTPRLERALSEVLELILEYRDVKLRQFIIPIIWSASVKPSRLTDTMIESIEAEGSRVSIAILKSTTPGWMRYHSTLASRAKPVRLNVNLTRLAESLLFGG